MVTQAEIDSLRTAIATGAKKVRYADGRETEFRSLSEMFTTLNRLQNDFDAQNRPCSGGGSRTSYVSFNRD